MPVSRDLALETCDIEKNRVYSNLNTPKIIDFKIDDLSTGIELTQRVAG